MKIPIWPRSTLLAVGIMAAGGAHAATSYDLAVNHGFGSHDTGLAGGQFTYEPLVLLNTSNVVAAGVTLTQKLPLGIFLDKIAGDAVGTCTLKGGAALPPMPFKTTSANQTIDCVVEDITAAGASNGKKVQFHVTIPEVGANWIASASAQPQTGHTDNGNDGGANHTDISRSLSTSYAADLGIQLSGPPSARQHESFNYVAKVTNLTTI